MDFLDYPLNFRSWTFTNPLSNQPFQRPQSPTVLVTVPQTPHIIKKATTNLLSTYRQCDPSYSYELSSNPIRPLTKPFEPKFNNGYDNENNNFILYVNDKLISPQNQEYIVLDTLGQGTFGQVFKCRKRGGSLCAAKVIKNKPAYYIQGLIEVKILSKLNRNLDPQDQHHIVRMLDFFVFRNHLIIIFELLSLNIYELIRKNSMEGFSMKLIRNFAQQLLEALCTIEQGNIVHCDLKPENILLEHGTINIKVIDFGSACFNDATIYTYIQSRYYRSPEVLLGIPYGSDIDSWSLGCICAELFIGIPLFPGCNEYQQLFRITQLLGDLPPQMVNEGKFRDKYFLLENGKFSLKSREVYSAEQGINMHPYRQYTNITSLDDLLQFERKVQGDSLEIETKIQFIDFLKGLLRLDPDTRWSAKQAIQHPFIQGSFNTQFFPVPSKFYSEIKKIYSAPAGALRGSCPSLLERIRNSQDSSSADREICFRPQVDQLKDDFFTGFAHGKLYKMAQPSNIDKSNSEAQLKQEQPVVPANRFMEMNFQPTVSSGQPRPVYARPYSYGPGSYKNFPRPNSPKVDDDRQITIKYQLRQKKQKIRSSSTSSKSTHKPKVVHTKTHSSTSQQETKRPKSPGHDRLLTLTQQLPNDLPPLGTATTPMGPKYSAPPNEPFLNKFKKQAEMKKEQEQDYYQQDKL